MKQTLLFAAGVQDSCRYAVKYLSEHGIRVIDHPSPDVTHLLLDVPTPAGNYKLWNNHTLLDLLRMLPEHVSVIGGNLEPCISSNYPCIDLLKIPVYLAKNAFITAECAIRAAIPHMTTIFADSPVLILGWGRIGKQLVRLLRSIGCPVTVAARSEEDRALLESLRYSTSDYASIPGLLPNIRILFNTVPQQTLDTRLFAQQKDCIVIDLASAPGLDYDQAVIARGLPGKYVPASSGRLIAQTIMTQLKEEAP